MRGGGGISEDGRERSANSIYGFRKGLIFLLRSGNNVKFSCKNWSNMIGMSQREG